MKYMVIMKALIILILSTVHYKILSYAKILFFESDPLLFIMIIIGTGMILLMLIHAVVHEFSIR